MTTADELRRAALSLPEAEERETWATRPFGSGTRCSPLCPTTAGRPASRRPRTSRSPWSRPPPKPFGFPAYVGRHGWVSVELASADPGEVRELVTDAWRQTAPRRLVAAYDAEHPAIAEPDPAA